MVLVAQGHDKDQRCGKQFGPRGLPIRTERTMREQGQDEVFRDMSRLAKDHVPELELRLSRERRTSDWA
jgi:hypothetical protein